MALTSALAAALLAQAARLAQATQGSSPAQAAPGSGRHLLETASSWILALLIVGIPVYGYLKGVKVYEAFIEGAKEGFATGVRIIPYLVAILAAVGAFRAAGAMDAFARVLAPVTGPLGLPAEVIPLAVVRPFSGGGALGILGSIFAASGPDSYAGRLASILQGSTETTFYVLSVYCGSVGIVRYRHALVAGLGADCTGLIASVTLARLLWG
jgi:spore maturation protein B